MSLQQIIDDLKAMGEDEAAMKLCFARLGLLKGYENCSGRLNETVPTIKTAFLWSPTPEGYEYWSNLHDRLERYRGTRS